MVENMSEPKGSLSAIAAGAYPGVGLMLYTATQDYLAARLCLQNGLHSGTALSAQAIEKTMKGILCFFDVSKFSGSIRGHKLPYLNAELRRRSLDAAFDEDLLLRKFDALYWSRYPDEPNHRDYPSSLNYIQTLHELDDMILHLWENMPESIGATYKGVLAVYGDSRRHEYSILLSGNRLARQWADLYSRNKQKEIDHASIWQKIRMLEGEELEGLSCYGKPAIEVPIEAIFARHTLRHRQR